MIDVGPIGSMVLIVIVVLAIIIIWLQSQPNDPEGLKNLIESLSPIGSYFTTWFTLVPYAVFLAGPIVDMITSQYMYTKASLVGIAAVAIVAFFGSSTAAKVISNVVPSIKTLAADGTSVWNWKGIAILATWVIAGSSLLITPFTIPGINSELFQMIAPGVGSFLILTLLAGSNLLGDVTPVVRTLSGDTSSSYAGITIEDVCATPGLGCVQTVFAPTGILLNTSIMSCHLFESIDTGNKESATIIGGIMGGTYLIELVTQWAKGCTSAYKYGVFSPLLIAPAIGMGAGAAAYYTMKRFALESFTQQSDETGVFHPPPSPEKAKKTSSDSTKKIVVGASADVSEPVDENQDAFVCEAYKDGELVTSTLVE